MAADANANAVNLVEENDIDSGVEDCDIVDDTNETFDIENFIGEDNWDIIGQPAAYFNLELGFFEVEVIHYNFDSGVEDNDAEDDNDSGDGSNNNSGDDDNHE